MNCTTIVCILGMHRSGTSVLARVLNLLGVYLGPAERLMPAAPENPRGFWEHLDITQTNDTLLARLGGTALDPPAIDAASWDGPAITDLQQKAASLVRRDFGKATLWGWKDPRTCLTLPFWQRLLPPMRYTLSLRHPLSVARSLERRDHLTTEQALQLWLNHLRLAFRYTAGQPRCLVFYEDLLGNWSHEVPLLARFIDQSRAAECAHVQAAIGDFLDTDLQHHRIARVVTLCGDPPADTIAAARLAQDAYDALHCEGLAQDEAACAMIDEALRLLGPEVRKQAAQRRDAAQRRWSAAQEALCASLTELVAPGDRFILADEEQTGVDCPDRTKIPFLERAGVYWGLPEDDGTAVRELERLRRAGAALVAFAWPSFWWLDHYAGLRAHLRSNFQCVREDEHVVAFRLC